ncbi:E3 ubiquitin ligase complex SCF subunit scon-3 [Smittium culicis]|uniref:E3 ubiquitin ligase complex SCF subunit scon-3 n=1 Tax=Smittium culicis TaxID=133412 RepID=A0A1R1YMC4_9FUNG|nr:E3 ubiquitin ligase complex SCF subunit scon-3 [Smittium culicis]
MDKEVTLITKEKSVHYQDYEFSAESTNDTARSSAIPETSKKFKTFTEPNEFDLDFIRVDQSTLYDLVMAANYLDIKPLLDLACYSIAKMFSGKSAQEIRNTFNLENDLDRGQELELERRNRWFTN